MKLLENSRFEAINSTIQSKLDFTLDARVESYSCKMAGNDKQLYKKISNGNSPSDLQTLSPPQNYNAWFGYTSQEEDNILCDTITLKILFYLVGTLNASFYPDYDFTDASSHQFIKVSAAEAVESVDMQLSSSMGEAYQGIRPSLWSAIEDEIILPECNVYSYKPDLQSDPFGEDGCLWSFNYFFYNRRLKRIVIFICRALSNSFSDPEELY